MAKTECCHHRRLRRQNLRTIVKVSAANADTARDFFIVGSTVNPVLLLLLLLLLLLPIRPGTRKNFPWKLLPRFLCLSSSHGFTAPKSIHL
jgi:hypothetical protein